jgi:hypothetical protein
VELAEFVDNPLVIDFRVVTRMKDLQALANADSAGLKVDQVLDPTWDAQTRDSTSVVASAVVRFADILS